MTDQPRRNRAANTRDALVDGHRLMVDRKSYVVNVWQGTFCLNTFRQYAEGKGFGFFAGLGLGCSIGKNAGQFRDFRNPAPVSFLFKVNDKVHVSSIQQVPRAVKLDGAVMPGAGVTPSTSAWRLCAAGIFLFFPVYNFQVFYVFKMLRIVGNKRQFVFKTIGGYQQIIVFNTKTLLL